MDDNIKDQIAQLNSEVNEILAEDSNLSPESLMDMANKVKGLTNVTSEEIAQINGQIIETPEGTEKEEVIQAAYDSVKNLKGLLATCTGIMNQIYSEMTSLDISEPRMIEAAASFVASMQSSIQSFIDIYRDEQHFLHTLALKQIDFENRKKLLKYKHDLDNDAIDTDATVSKTSYSQEDLIRFLDEQDNKDKVDSMEENNGNRL